MSTVKSGIFCISLDFELHWGCIENKPVMNDDAIRYFSNTRKAIPQMLSLFHQHEIHVTWAIVGMLFNKNVEEWKSNIPNKIPSYSNNDVSSYDWIQKNGFKQDDDPCHFALSIIEKIKSTPYQEIGTHTYSHYFCLEPFQTKEEFKADLLKAIEVASSKGIELTSLVFPRNQFNNDYLSVCKELNINAVRSNPSVWYWSPAASAGLLTKIFRTGEAYFNLDKRKSIPLKALVQHALPVQLPASRLYRPWKPSFKFQNKLKLNRILNEMTVAAQKGEYYHIWWHPHNFGNHPEQCLQELSTMLNHYQLLKEKYGFNSMNMKEITQQIALQKDFESK